MKFWEPQGAIYGIFKEGRCLYVGQSRNVATRLRCHLRPSSRFCGAVGRILEKGVSLQQLPVQEGHWIRRMKAKGEASFNKHLKGSPGPTSFNGPYRTCRRYFRSRADVAQFLGVTSATVSKWWRLAGCDKPFHCLATRPFRFVQVTPLLGALGGKAGKGKAKARSTKVARAAGRQSWKNRK